jgi:hypothetical protein
VDKINQLYVLLTLAKCDSTIIIFDVWMSKGAHDMFTLVINILRMDLQPKTCDYLKLQNKLWLEV